MPTSHWWTRASHISLRVITVAWWISSKRIADPLPMSCPSAAVTTVACYCCYLLPLLLATAVTTALPCHCSYSLHYCYLLQYFSGTIDTTTSNSLPCQQIISGTVAIILPLLHISCLQILIFQVWLNLTIQLLILESILSPPIVRINKFGSNTLPSKTAANPRIGGPSTTFF